MPAEWKRKAHERLVKKDELAQAKEQIAELQAAAKDLKLQLHKSREVSTYWRDRFNQIVPQARSYAFMKKMGVLIEDEGQFKFLEGEDLDDYCGVSSQTSVTADAPVASNPDLASWEQAFTFVKWAHGLNT